MGVFRLIKLWYIRRRRADDYAKGFKWASERLSDPTVQVSDLLDECGECSASYRHGISEAGWRRGHLIAGHEWEAA